MNKKQFLQRNLDYLSESAVQSKLSSIIDQEEQTQFDQQAFNDFVQEQSDERKLRQVQQSRQRREISKDFRKQMPKIRDDLTVAGQEPEIYQLRQQISALNHRINDLEIQYQELKFRIGELVIEPKKSQIPCICDRNSVSCQANGLSHICICHKLDYNSKSNNCRAVFLHKCICENNCKQCISDKHVCLCTYTKNITQFNRNEQGDYAYHLNDLQEKISKLLPTKINETYGATINDTIFNNIFGDRKIIYRNLYLIGCKLKNNKNECRSDTHNCICEFINLINKLMLLNDKNDIEYIAHVNSVLKDRSLVNIGGVDGHLKFLMDFVETESCKSNLH